MSLQGRGSVWRTLRRCAHRAGRRRAGSGAALAGPNTAGTRRPQGPGAKHRSGWLRAAPLPSPGRRTEERCATQADSVQRIAQPMLATAADPPTSCTRSPGWCRRQRERPRRWPTRQRRRWQCRWHPAARRVACGVLWCEACMRTRFILLQGGGGVGSVGGWGWAWGWGQVAAGGTRAARIATRAILTMPLQVQHPAAPADCPPRAAPLREAARLSSCHRAGQPPGSPRAAAAPTWCTAKEALMPAPLTDLPCSYRRRTEGPMPLGATSTTLMSERKSTPSFCSRQRAGRDYLGFRVRRLGFRVRRGGQGTVSTPAGPPAAALDCRWLLYCAR